MSPKLSDGKRKNWQFKHAVHLFLEISGTQRKSIIEVRQVLSKYEHFAEFCPTSGEGHRENPRLWPRAKVSAVSLRRLARGEEACVQDICIFTPRKRSNFLILARIA